MLIRYDLSGTYVFLITMIDKLVDPQISKLGHMTRAIHVVFRLSDIRLGKSGCMIRVVHINVFSDLVESLVI